MTEAGLSRALPAWRAGVRLELCTHSCAWCLPCLGNRLGQGAFVDWQDGWVQRLCQPIPLFSFQTWLELSFFLEASKSALSQFFSVWSFVYTSYARASTLHVLYSLSPFSISASATWPDLSLCQEVAEPSDSPLAVIFSVLNTSRLFTKCLRGMVAVRQNFSLKSWLSHKNCLHASFYQY